MAGRSSGTRRRLSGYVLAASPPPPRPPRTLTHRLPKQLAKLHLTPIKPASVLLPPDCSRNVRKGSLIFGCVFVCVYVCAADILEGSSGGGGAADGLGLTEAAERKDLMNMCPARQRGNLSPLLPPPLCKLSKGRTTL